MSNQINDQLADLAIDIVAKVMATNGTIPEEARKMLEKEEYQRLLEESEELTEPEDWELISEGGMCGEDEEVE